MDGLTFLLIFWGLLLAHFDLGLWGWGFVLRMLGFGAVAIGCRRIQSANPPLRRASVAAMTLVVWIPLGRMVPEGGAGLVAFGLGAVLLRLSLIVELCRGLSRITQARGKLIVSQRLRLCGMWYVFATAVWQVFWLWILPPLENLPFELIGILALPFTLVYLSALVYLGVLLFQSTEAGL